MNSTARPSQMAVRMACAKGVKTGTAGSFLAICGGVGGTGRLTSGMASTTWKLTSSRTASTALAALAFAGAFGLALALGSAGARLAADFLAGALAFGAGLSSSTALVTGFLRGVLDTAMGVRLLAHHPPILLNWSTSQFDGSMKPRPGRAGRMRSHHLRLAVVRAPTLGAADCRGRGAASGGHAYRFGSC